MLKPPQTVFVSPSSIEMFLVRLWSSQSRDYNVTMLGEGESDKK